MSMQDAKAFIERVYQDEALRKTARERFRDIVNVGGENGFPFTQKEFDDALRERKESDKDDKHKPHCHDDDDDQQSIDCSNDCSND